MVDQQSQVTNHNLSQHCASTCSNMPPKRDGRKTAAAMPSERKTAEDNIEDSDSATLSSASSTGNASDSDDGSGEAKEDAQQQVDIDWRHHPARAVLKQGFLDNEIPLNYKDTIKPKGVFEMFKSHPAFALMPYDATFTRRLRDMKNQVSKKLDRVNIDQKAYDIFIKKHPPPTHNENGDPRWEGSAAQVFLKKDMKRGRHKNKTPLKFWQSRPEYQLFRKETFRKHIDQEKRLWKLENLLKAKAKREARKKRWDSDEASSDSSNSAPSPSDRSDALSSSSSSSSTSSGGG